MGEHERFLVFLGIWVVLGIVSGILMWRGSFEAKRKWFPRIAILAGVLFVALVWWVSGNPKTLYFSDAARRSTRTLGGIVLASVRSACVGTVLGMIVAACSSEMADSPIQVEVVVNILPGGDRCAVRGVELACSDVPAHLRNVLKLEIGHPVSVRADASSHPTFEQVNALFDGLRKAQFGLKVAYLTPSANNAE